MMAVSRDDHLERAGADAGARVDDGQRAGGGWQAGVQVDGLGRGGRAGE